MPPETKKSDQTQEGEMTPAPGEQEENEPKIGALQWVEAELRGSGDPADLVRADVIAALIRSRGEDIPLPNFSEPIGVDDRSSDAGAVALMGDEVYAVKDNGNAIVSADPRTEIEHQEEKAELSYRLKNLIEPYTRIFMDHLPSAESNPRNFFGWNKIGKIGKTSSSYEDVRDGLNVRYLYDVEYEQGESANSLRTIRVRITSQLNAKAYSEVNGRPYEPFTTIEISLDHGDVTGMDLYWQKPDSPTLFRLSGDNALTEFLKEFFTDGGGNLSIDLKGTDPTFKIVTPGPYHNNLESTFRYDPASDEFIRYIVDLSAHSYSKREYDISLRDKVTPEELKSVIRGILSLIPTIKASEIEPRV